MTIHQYIEIAHFKTLPEVTEEALLSANAALSAQQAQNVPGFIGRELLRENDGSWFVILRMRDQASMESFLQNARKAPTAEMRAFGALLEKSSMRLEFANLRFAI